MAKRRAQATRDRCFYCGLHLVRHRSNNTESDQLTIDHVVPRSRIADHPDTVYWSALNRVFCCHRCNQAKANMWPTDWLLVCPSFGAEALSGRLYALGCPLEDVRAAMQRRDEVRRPLTLSVIAIRTALRIADAEKGTDDDEEVAGVQ